VAGGGGYLDVHGSGQRRYGSLPSLARRPARFSSLPFRTATVRRLFLNRSLQLPCALLGSTMLLELKPGHSCDPIVCFSRDHVLTVPPLIMPQH
jgi:hypothetical protein